MTFKEEMEWYEEETRRIKKMCKELDDELLIEDCNLIVNKYFINNNKMVNNRRIK